MILLVSINDSRHVGGKGESLCRQSQGVTAFGFLNWIARKSFWKLCFPRMSDQRSFISVLLQYYPPCLGHQAADARKLECLEWLCHRNRLRRCWT